METMENTTANASGRRATMFGNEIASDTSHLKTEVVLLQRKYERLQQKERRMQVYIPGASVIKFSMKLFTCT